MDIKPMYRCAVGIDVHLAVITVCVIVQSDAEEPEVHRHEFGSFRRDRIAMAKWIASFKPDVVVMESTGIYWKSPYAFLEREGIRPLVVNAQHVKKVPGRKTDVNDAEWLAMLARPGLLRGSFIPPEELRNLRQISRRHHSLTGDLAAEKNRLVRVLGDAGIRITVVVSDPHGVAATAMIDCLLDGGTPEQALKFAGRLKAPREELLAALEGELSAEHRYVAQSIRAHIQFLRGQLAELENQLYAGLQAHEGAMILLMTIPGIDKLAAAKLLVELGEDMKEFGSADRLSKWCGVCPGNNESAGKRHSGKTAKANRYVRSTLCEISHAAARTTSQFKGLFQDLMARRGMKRAIIAIAHKIVRIIFVLLSRKIPYQDSTVDYQALAVKKRAPRWLNQLRKYGLMPATARP